MASAAKQATSEMEVVWSGPLPNDAMGRTTWAVLSEVVQNAHEYIYAATYSAGHNAPAIQALRSAIERGIQVTCMVDVHHRPEAIEILKAELLGARLLGLVKPGNEFAPMMHAKFIVVDGHSTFLTSANFSNIAVDKSLEVGLLELRLHFKTNLGVQSTQLKLAVDTHVSPRPADSKHRPRGSI